MSSDYLRLLHVTASTVYFKDKTKISNTKNSNYNYKQKIQNACFILLRTIMSILNSEFPLD